MYLASRSGERGRGRLSANQLRVRVLTDDELAAIAYLGRGETLKALAMDRGRAEGTVRTWAKRAYRKLGVSSAPAAVLRAKRRRLI